MRTSKKRGIPLTACPSQHWVLPPDGYPAVSKRPHRTGCSTGPLNHHLLERQAHRELHKMIVRHTVDSAAMRANDFPSQVQAKPSALNCRCISRTSIKAACGVYVEVCLVADP